MLMLRRGRCFALCVRASTPSSTSISATVPRFFVVYNLTAGRVKLKLLKMKKSMFTAFAIGLCLTASVMAQVPNYVPTNGLVGYWPFNGNANDVSGNGNNGNVNSAILTSDRFGNANKAYSFDGTSNSIIRIPHQVLSQNPCNTNWTISFWINKSIIDSIFAVPFCNASNPGVDGIHPFCYPKSSGQFEGYWWKRSAVVTQDSVFSSNVWYNFTFVYTNLGNSLKVYINGSDNSGITVDLTGKQGTDNNYGNWYVGGNIQYNTFFNGIIDDICIWDRALSQQEISNLYTPTNCANNTAISPHTNSLTTSSTATFTATTSDPNPAYVWQSDFGQGFQTLNNFGNYSGAYTSTLTINNLQLANHLQQIRAIFYIRQLY